MAFLQTPKRQRITRPSPHAGLGRHQNRTEKGLDRPNITIFVDIRLFRILDYLTDHNDETKT